MTRATLAETPSPNWTPDQPIVRIADVHKSFGTFEVLKGISFDVRKGEVVCIIGPSGSGKSTLIRCINRLETIESGTITLDGQPLPAEGRELARLRADIGMVFQSFNLFAHKSVLDNLTLGPVKVRGLDKGAARERALALFDEIAEGNAVVVC